MAVAILLERPVSLSSHTPVAKSPLRRSLGEGKGLLKYLDRWSEGQLSFDVHEVWQAPQKGRLFHSGDQVDF